MRVELIPWRGEDSRHGISGCFAGGLFGGRAPSLGGSDEEREPEPPAPVAGCGSGRHEPDGGSTDWWHGPADAARLGPSVQRAWPDGLLDSWSKGPEPRLSSKQRAEVAELVSTRPDQAIHGVVRWRRIDLQRVILERFGIGSHERTIGKLLKALGFSDISAERATQGWQPSRAHSAQLAWLEVQKAS